jgi:hypothetical protein
MSKQQSTTAPKTALDALFAGVAHLLSGGGQKGEQNRSIVIIDEVTVTGPFGDSAHGVSKTTISNVTSHQSASKSH